jgi:tRNA1Val (adenine37-N6)-methyltransferase
VTPNDPGDTEDTLFGGDVVLHQPARGGGYRVNVDAVLLAAFAGQERVAKRAIDLGAGVGAVGLSLLYRERAARVVLVEVDAGLARLAEKNLADNAWSDRGEVVVSDVSRARDVAPGDLVVCNPPYVAPGRGRAPLVAKGARMGELRIFTDAALRLLAGRGRAAFVYPAQELATLLETLRASGLEPKRLRLVHAREDAPARVALVLSVVAKRGGLVVDPPLVEWDSERAMGGELRRLLERGGREPTG